jgi:hypothetical protein
MTIFVNGAVISTDLDTGHCFHTRISLLWTLSQQSLGVAMVVETKSLREIGGPETTVCVCVCLYMNCLACVPCYVIKQENIIRNYWIF